MNKLTFTPILLLVLLNLMIKSSYAFTLDARAEYETWNSGLGGTSTALMKGLSGTFELSNQFALGVGFVTGDYKSNTIGKSATGRMDTDITLSYRYQPGISLFAGYQLIQLDYDNVFDNTRSFKDTSHGFGAGILTHHSLANRWYLYGGLGLTFIYATSALDNGTKDRGAGYSTSFNGGILFGIDYKTSLATGVKTRLTTVDYKGESGRWAHNYTRLVFSLTRSF